MDVRSISSLLRHTPRPSLYDVPLRRMVAIRPELGDLLGRPRELPPVEVVRHEDLLHLTFSFVNLTFERASDGQPPLLRRRARNRPAFLVVDCRSQHLTEEALFERAPGYPVVNPRPPLDLPAAAAPKDPDEGKLNSDPFPPPAPPIFASLAGSSRLVFKVGSQAIPYSVEGLLGAITTLELSVAPHALPPSAAPLPGILELLVSDAVDLTPVFARAAAPAVRVVRGRQRVHSPQGGTRVAAELIALGRMRATAAALEYRFGTEAALSAVPSTSIGGRIGIEGPIGRIDILEFARPPVSAPASATETSIELPWRLQLSPNEHGAFAHSVTPIEHEGRFELWHTRLGVRAIDKQGNPVVDEREPRLRTVRAIWARDFEVFPAIGKPEFGFVERPSGANLPPASRAEDWPGNRMALNSRDRMMLVHQTSNFRLRRRRRPWTPPAVPTNRLMLTALGGWLDSRVFFDTLPDGGLTIEEWKHRAALGRDHEVKVVYSGFLLPFGHKASLIKLTERKLAPGTGGTAAYLFQRMFIAVREPEKRFRTDSRVVDGRRLNLVMPFVTVRILTRVTPMLDEPQSLVGGGGGFIFEPHVLDAPFLFKLVAVDLENNIVEFSAPLVFMERDRNEGNLLDAALVAYNTNSAVHREFDLRGQRVAYAESERPDDTILSTRSVIFDAKTAPFLKSRPQDEPRFEPLLREAKAVVPAMSALTGAAAPTKLKYPAHYASNGFTNNAAQVFLEAPDKPELSFAGQGDRSGGLVTPSLGVAGLSRVTGPIGGNVQDAMTNAGAFDVGQFFAGVPARLFGIIPLSELFGAAGFSPERVPKFVTQVLDVATVLTQNVQRIRNAANAHAAQLGAAATNLQTQADVLLADLTALAADPDNPPNLEDDLGDLAGTLEPFIQAVEGADLLQAQKLQLAGVARRVQDQLEDAAAVAAAAQALVQFAQGLKLPEVVTGRLDWSTGLDPWPAADPIFQPVGPQAQISVAVELQAPTRPGKQPSALVSCSLSPFELRLIGSATFLVLHFDVIEFSMQPGKKPDVNVKLRDPGGIVFAGPLAFVERLKDVIPLDGFSDPPYLDATAEGIKAGFDLEIPDLAVGVFALTNISLGAHFKVPFLDESIETAFNFATRENPFRLQVSLFAGGGFFGITITPERVRILEAALEFGAAVSIDFGVASGGVEVMAGIYFRLEVDQAGEENAWLTGYFRMRGEVDALGLLSVCIELYLELTYETATGKAVGRATLTIEVEVAFFSASVEISCEKKFAGSSGDPSFADVMGLPAPGAVRAWDTYVRAFAED